jgi:uncharacterized membrane protein
MEIIFENLFMTLLVLLTGLSAGLCFTWQNAVTPGIGELDDRSFLSSFQQMNRSIINPLFIITFFGPSILGIIDLMTFESASTGMNWIRSAAIIIYFLGVVLVTIFGNVPLNNTLDAKDLITANSEELKSIRHHYKTINNNLKINKNGKKK